MTRGCPMVACYVLLNSGRASTMSVDDAMPGRLILAMFARSQVRTSVFIKVLGKQSQRVVGNGYFDSESDFTFSGKSAARITPFATSSMRIAPMATTMVDVRLLKRVWTTHAIQTIVASPAMMR